MPIHVAGPPQKNWQRHSLYKVSCYVGFVVVHCARVPDADVLVWMAPESTRIVLFLFRTCQIIKLFCGQRKRPHRYLSVVCSDLHAGNKLLSEVILHMLRLRHVDAR